MPEKSNEVGDDVVAAGHPGMVRLQFLQLRSKNPMRRGQRGMKWWPVPLGLGLLGLAGWCAVEASNRPDETQPHVAVSLVFSQVCVDEYAQRHGRLPDNWDEIVTEHRRWAGASVLESDQRKPWMLRSPQDPWGATLRFEHADPATAKGAARETLCTVALIDQVLGYRIWSPGPDGIDSTVDDVMLR